MYAHAVVAYTATNLVDWSTIVYRYKFDRGWREALNRRNERVKAALHIYNCGVSGLPRP